MLPLPPDADVLLAGVRLRCQGQCSPTTQLEDVCRSLACVDELHGFQLQLHGLRLLLDINDAGIVRTLSMHKHLHSSREVTGSRLSLMTVGTKVKLHTLVDEGINAG